MLAGATQGDACWCYSGRCLLVLLRAMLAGVTLGDACWCYSGRCLLVLLRAMLAGATQGDACWCYSGRCLLVLLRAMHSGSARAGTSGKFCPFVWAPLASPISVHSCSGKLPIGSGKSQRMHLMLGSVPIGAGKFPGELSSAGTLAVGLPPLFQGSSLLDWESFPLVQGSSQASLSLCWNALYWSWEVPKDVFGHHVTQI